MSRNGVRRIASLFAMALVFASACDQRGTSPVATVTGDDAVTVASFAFAESVILAEIYAQALEERGFTVERAHELGPRELVEPALEKGLIEFVPEYLGTALDFLRKQAGEGTPDIEATYRELVGEFERRGIAALEPASAQDANGIAVTEETAERFDLQAISDLIPFAGELVFGGPPECPSRPLCLDGLERVYGLRFKSFLSLDTSGQYTVAALEQGRVDVALLFTGSGYIAANNFVLLRDDLRLQPAENIVPVVRSEILDRYGDEFVAAVDAVSMRLTTEELIELNRLVSLDGEDPAAVATHWLVSQGLLE
jgi:osmoprotectant transport system substrate-binding protein